MGNPLPNQPIATPPLDYTPSAGEHQHTVTNLNRVYCHADHTCPAGQRLVGHDTCVVLPPPPCTPSAGEHQHTVTNLNQVYCHADHTCDTGQHLGGHDTCHDDHTCPPSQRLQGHEDCVPIPPPVICDSSEHRHSTLGNNSYCHADHTCSAGQHLGGHDTCHDDHTCPAGQQLQGHDTCVAIPPPPCTPSAGEHKHTVTNLNQVYCHADHTCDTGQHLSGHDTCHADHNCPAGQHLSGHETCHADHTCDTGQHLHGHDDCDADHTCDTGQHLSGHETCHDDHTCPTDEHFASHDTCHDDHTCEAEQTLYVHDTCCPTGLHAHAGPVGSAACHATGTDHYPLPKPSGLGCATHDYILLCVWDTSRLAGVVYEWRFDDQHTWRDAGAEGRLQRTGRIDRYESVSVRAKIPLFGGGFKFSQPTIVPILQNPITECPSGQHKHYGDHPDRWRSYYGNPRECHGLWRTSLCHGDVCRDIELFVTETVPDTVVAVSCTPIGQFTVADGAGLLLGRIGKAMKLGQDAVRALRLTGGASTATFLTLACADDESDVGYTLGAAAGIYLDQLISAFTEMERVACQTTPITPLCRDLRGYTGTDQNE